MTPSLKHEINAAIDAELPVAIEVIDAAQQVDAIAQHLEGPNTRWLKSEPVKNVLESWEQEELDEKPEMFDTSGD